MTITSQIVSKQRLNNIKIIGEFTNGEHVQHRSTDINCPLCENDVLCHASKGKKMI